MWRQLNNTVADSDRVEITLDGKTFQVPKHISVAAAMIQIETDFFRTTAISNNPRAPFCMMGVCFDCLIQIDGRGNQRACMTSVREGMQLHRQKGAINPEGDQ